MENKLILEKKTISPEILNQLKKHHELSQELVVKFGQVEMQMQELISFKKELIKAVENQKIIEKQLSETLQNTYGNGNINLETGEFTPVA